MIRPWWQVAIPHKDIREGKLTDFAADLGSILKGQAAIEYLDPETFFRRTYFTQGLKNIIKDTLSVLSGKESSKIIQIQTPFGGGKTHALVSLYHLIKSGKKVSHLNEVKEVLSSEGLTKIPQAEIVVFVGTVPDPLKGKTPWGEIAEQLGLYELVKEHDKRRITPGREILEKILDVSKPLAILIDEITEYTVKAREFEDQIFAFCQELTEAIKATDRCILVCTLPSSAPYGERGERVLSQLQRIFGRMQVIYTPVEGEEIYEILRRRIFEDLGDNLIHKLVAEEYFSLYLKLGDEVPHEAREIQYKEKVQKAYPFHPEIIDILFERWGSIPTFQRTRGVLRLLAGVVSDLFLRQHPSPLIQPAHINLANSRIRRMFIEHIGEVFESVIASDITNGGAKAVIMDRQIGSEYARFNVATSLATSIFFYSFSGAEKRGITTQRLRLAFLREGIPAPIIGDAIRRLEDELWFLHHDEKNDLYFFSSTVGLNRVIIDKEEAIREEDIEGEIKRRIEKISGDEFEVFIWPKLSSNIPDNKKLKLIILSPRYFSEEPQTEELVKEIINKYSAGFRTYKNTLIFLTANQDEYEGLKGVVRRLLALHSIKTDKQTMQRLTEEDRSRVEQKLKEADTTIFMKLLSAYRFLSKASKEGVQTFDLGIPTVGEKVSLSKRAKEYLKDQEILLDKISPKALLDKTFYKEDEQKSFAEVWEAFLKFPELPMLESEQVIKQSVVQGVQSGAIGLLAEDKVRYEEVLPLEEVSGDVYIIRKETAHKLKKAKVEIKPEEAKPSMPKPIEGVIKKISLRALVPWDKLSDLVRGVLAPLSREGAQISLEVKIEAQSEKGIKKDTLDLKRETLNQIGAKVMEEKEE